MDYAQIRLEGARLFHCMRLIGLSSRAMDVAQDYAAQRDSHGARLSEHQMVQAMVANAMAQPVGWDASARAYADLFEAMTIA